MRKILTMYLFWLALLAFAVSEARAQGLSVDELLQGLEDQVKKKDDEKAISILGELTDRFPKMTEEEQKKVVKDTSKVLGRNRPEGEDDLFVAAVQSLGKMGPEGAKSLTTAIKGTVKKRFPALATALIALSAGKDPAHVPVIEEHLVHSEALIVAASAEALGAYGEQPEPMRKQIVEELVKTYAGIAATAAARPKEPVFGQRLSKIDKPMKNALSKLTGQTFDNATDWERWYNKNKRVKWEPVEKKGDGG